jgi:hypothetical protein
MPHLAENFFSLLQFPSGERINAHKLILTLFSPVFEAEFYGSLNQDGEILITDIGRMLGILGSKLYFLLFYASKRRVGRLFSAMKRFCDVA